jgi:hypothetical protein
VEKVSVRILGRRPPREHDASWARHGEQVAVHTAADLSLQQLAEFVFSILRRQRFNVCAACMIQMALVN